MEPDRDVADLQDDHLPGRSIFEKRKRDFTDGESGIELEFGDGGITKKQLKRYLHDLLADLTPTFEGEKLSREGMMRLRNTLLQIVSHSESKELGLLDNKRKVFQGLYRALRARELAIAQLTLDGLDENKRAFCIYALEERREQMLLLEKEFSMWNDLFETRFMAVKLINQIVNELDHNIRLYDKTLRQGHLAEFIPLTQINLLNGIAYPNRPKPMENLSHGGAFTLFKRFPAEIRQLIWKYALPGPRVLTHSALHNISLLSVCRESREVVKLSYVPLLRPRSGFDSLQYPTSVLWVNSDIDTIVIDLTAPQTEDSGPSLLDRSLFSLGDQEFMKEVFTRLVGLSRVKHLALAFNVIHDNGGALFLALQAAYPDLQTLTVFPNSQMHVSARDHKLWGEEDLRFVDVDSNLIDYVWFRRDLLLERRDKVKSCRSLGILYQLDEIARQYVSVFPEHTQRYGLRISQKRSPSVRLCLLASKNNLEEGFRTLHLEGDEYLRGYPQEDGKLCEGFLESGMVCDIEGEPFSRYDGIKQLFDEEN